MSRATRATSDTADPGDGARTTAASAAAEEDNTTGLVRAPDPAADSSAEAAATDRARQDHEVRRDEAGPGPSRFQPVEVSAVPPGVRATAAWAWRIVAIAGAGYVALLIIARIRVVVIPLAIALLLSALLQPLAAVLAKRGLRPALATAVTLLSGLIGVGLLLWLVEEQFRNGLGDLTNQVNGGIDKVQDWLINGPLGLSQQQINDYVDRARDSISANRSKLTSGALGAPRPCAWPAAGRRPRRARAGGRRPRRAPRTGREPPRHGPGPAGRGSGPG